jgi:hypothetical protein
MRTELVNAEDEDGLVDLESEDLGLDEGKRLSVNLDETLSGLENHREYVVRLRARSWYCVCTLQWATAVGDIVSLRSLHCSAIDCSYQSRSSSCRSIARSGWRPYWATVDVRAVSMGVVGFAVVRQAKLEMSTSKRISTADVASVRTSAPSVSAVSKTPQTDKLNATPNTSRFDVKLFYFLWECYTCTFVCHRGG